MSTGFIKKLVYLLGWLIFSRYSCRVCFFWGSKNTWLLGLSRGLYYQVLWCLQEAMNQGSLHEPRMVCRCSRHFFDKDPCKPISIMECHKGFERCSDVASTCTFDALKLMNWGGEHLLKKWIQ